MNRVTTSRFRNVLGMAMLLAALVSLPLTGSAAGQLANVSAGSSSLEFSPVVEYGSMVLTVSGGGQAIRREFEAGQRISFDLIDDQGYALADDNYTWELTMAPSLDTLRSRMAEAREYGEVAAPEERLIQSGYFTIHGGALLPEAEEERGSDGGATSLSAPVTSVSAADQVILDDLIVDGSICAGFDCVNGESFGFDTIRIKENNLRIRAVDTSNSASFPTNDWQITFNDTSNGGANKFSIDDIDGGRTPFTIEANAPSHSLYVDDGGRIGFGTSTPVVELHVKDGDSPTLRLEQDGSSGFTSQTWDVAGNEAGFFVRDATNGSTLPFRIRPGAPSSAIDIAAGGNVGIGTTSPNATLDVEGDVDVSNTGIVLVDVESTDNNAVQIRMRSDSTNRRFLAQNAGGTTVSQIIFNDSEIRFAGPTDSGANLYGILNTNGLITLGATCNPGPCDGTFRADFEVPTIEEHAEFMWTNSHLWGVGSTPEGAPINLSKKTTGILHELEVAHIYIEQLHRQLKEKDAELGDISERLATIEGVLEKLAAEQ